MATNIETEQAGTVTGTVGFGLGQVDKPTPKWVTWAFRIFLYAASFATVVVTTDNAIPPHTALLIAKYLAYAVMGAHGLSKLVGVNIQQDADDAKNAFNLKK